MALVILCGYPACGKSNVAQALAVEVSKTGRRVLVVGDGGAEAFAAGGVWTVLRGARGLRGELYLNASSEKRVRSELRGAAERGLGEHEVVIVDSMNYVRGYRYELWCAARAHGAACSLIHVGDGDSIACIRRDTIREDSYGRELVRALVGRFEMPRLTREWDAPLKRNATAADTVALTLCILDAKPLVHNSATRMPIKPGSDVLGALDAATRAAEAELLGYIRESGGDGGGVGRRILLTHSTRPVILARAVRVSEIRSMRRALLNLARHQPPNDLSREAVVNEYVDYVNAQLSL